MTQPKKCLRAAALLLVNTLIWMNADAQLCQNGVAPETKTYEKILAQNTGNSSDTIVFPQLSLTNATLINAQLNSKIIIGNFKYTIENKEPVGLEYEVELTRRDRIYLMNEFGVFPNTPISQASKDWLSPVSYYLAAADNPLPDKSGPDFVSDGPFLLWDNVDGVNYSTTSAAFQGADSVRIRYAGISTGVAVGGLLVEFNPSIEVQTKFTLTYTYCPLALLPGVVPPVTPGRNNTQPEKGIRIYPNPAVGEITVDLSGYKEKGWLLSLYTIDGKLLQQKRIATSGGLGKFTPATFVAKGTYVLKAANPESGTVVSTRLFVNR